MYPGERSLVSNLQGKPFVLLGINSDRDRELLKTVLKKEQIIWRSWWDGGKTSGPIATKWNVVAWPTVYVLDGKGVIRYKDVGPAELKVVVETLLKEMESKKP
jgi:hypothetical protein